MTSILHQKNGLEVLDRKARTTLSLDLSLEFKSDGGGAGLISIKHFTTISANFRG